MPTWFYCLLGYITYWSVAWPAGSLHNILVGYVTYWNSVWPTAGGLHRLLGFMAYCYCVILRVDYHCLMLSCNSYRTAIHTELHCLLGFQMSIRLYSELDGCDQLAEWVAYWKSEWHTGGANVVLWQMACSHGAFLTGWYVMVHFLTFGMSAIVSCCW